MVREFERVLQPKLRRLALRAALVNGRGRVIVSNSARLPAGSLMRDAEGRPGGTPAHRARRRPSLRREAPIVLVTS